MRTLLRGLGALIGLAAALVGLPMLLLWIPQGSLAQLLPHTSELPDLILGNPLDPGVILLALIAVGWICWAQLLVSFIIEVVYEVRGVQVPNLGRFMPQTSVARAVSAIALMAATVLPTTPSHAAPPPAAAAAQATGNEASADVLRVSPASHSAASHRYRTYEVRDGDCLWDIADHQLGDPARWPEIYKASTKLVQPDGQRLTDPDVLLPGWRLNIPVMKSKHPSKTPAKAPQPEATKAEPSSTSQQPQPEAQPTPDRTPDREPAMAGSPLRLGGGDSALPTTPAHLTGQPSRPVTPFQQPATDQFPDHTVMRPSTGLQTLPDWLSGRGRQSD